MNRASALRIVTPDPQNGAIRTNVLGGLTERPKSLPCKLFYDRLGSQLFEDICELDEYYLTRTELAILEKNASEIAQRLGPECVLVELGSGASVKTRILLDALDRPKSYVPVDISRSALVASAARIASTYPGLAVRPICADYTLGIDFLFYNRPESLVAFFPGSTIGNFDKPEAVDFLARIRGLVGPSGKLLIGVDLKKERAILEAAYNDRAGVTAEFNLNILRVMNREHGAQFSLEAFAHRAVFNDRAGRIEMHLVSERRQAVEIGALTVHFDEGEHIVTEHSYKYDVDEFRVLAQKAGFQIERVWTDPDRHFSVQLLSPT